jgi:hypothetical protein
MNTWIWGPPKWKFLHTLSFSPEAQDHAEEIALFLQCLGYVLPCVFCRESYVTYGQQLQQLMNNMSLTIIIQSSQLSLWMYKLHEMVNDKLNVQAIKALVDENIAESGRSSASTFVSEDLDARQRTQLEKTLQTLLRQRQIAFPCLVKRFKVRPIAFCDGDIWDVLKIFALNVDNRLQETSDPSDPIWQPKAGPSSPTHFAFTCENAELVRWWVKYVELLPRMVQIAGGSPSLVAALINCSRITRRRSTVLGAASNQCRIHCFFSVVVMAQNNQDGCGCTRGTSQVGGFDQSSRSNNVSVEAEKQLYDIVQASVCKDNSCK